MRNTFGFDISTLTAYQGYFLDEDKLKASASGGGATILSETVIDMGGVVFGVVYSDDFKNSEYYCADTKDKLNKLKSSKYIYSKKEICIDGEYKSVYQVVADYLNQGRYVLYTGLGCDTYALDMYLKKNNVNTDKLYLVDLICHGPTDPVVAKEYIENLEKRFKSKVVDFNVRYKKKGWTPPYIYAAFENGQIFTERFYDSDYGYAFGKYSRQGCYSCRFKGANHVADITLGDYWGITKKMKGFNPNGVSLFIVKSKKGNNLLKKIDTNKFKLRNADVEFALKYNHSYYEIKSKYKRYDSFVADIKDIGLNKAVYKDMGFLKYYITKSGMKSLIITILEAVNLKNFFRECKKKLTSRG